MSDGDLELGTAPSPGRLLEPADEFSAGPNPASSLSTRPAWHRPLVPPLAVVAERLVALPDCVAPPDLLSPVDEVESFLCVTRHTVEDESEEATGVGLVLVPGDVVEHPLHHLQLVERQARHPLGQRSRP